MLTPELIRAEWMKRFCVGDGRATRATLTEEQAVENFARVIEQAARREAMERACDALEAITGKQGTIGRMCAVGECINVIRALIEHETK